MIGILGEPLRGRAGLTLPVQKQGRGVRYGWAAARASSGRVHCFGCHQPSAKGSARGGDGGGRAENALSHGVLSRGQHCCSPAVTLLASHRPTHCALDPYSSTPTAPIHSLSTFQTLAPSSLSISGREFSRVAVTSACIEPCHEHNPCRSRGGAKPADGMQAWHEGARLGSARMAESFPPQQSSVVSCAPAAGPS